MGFPLHSLILEYTEEISLTEGYCFKSDLFTIHKGEDDETNPGCYGKELSEWLCSKLSESGYASEVIPEDWGWCVMCDNRDYLLWVGCLAMCDAWLGGNIPENPPKGSEVVWHTFPIIEVPFFKFKSLIRKWMGKLDTDTPLKKLDKQLLELLDKEPKIIFCDAP